MPREPATQRARKRLRLMLRQGQITRQEFARRLNRLSRDQHDRRTSTEDPDHAQ